jgi:3-oxoacyl-[acyl-carrier-protein] synthase-3
MVLLATSTPDHPLPPTAPSVAWRLGCRPGVPALDLAAACSGFVYALSVGEKFVRSGEARHLLLIGANVMSRRVDWEDPDTASLFADGAGAVVLSPSLDPRRGVLSTVLASWGEGASLLWVPSGGSRTPLTAEGLERKEDRIRMAGPALARRAVRMMEEVLGELLRREGMRLEEVDWLLPHQANRRILDSLARRLGFPRERMIVNVGEVGNTSAASIPIALDQARSAGRIREGEVMALLAFGGGLTAGAALLRW